MRFLQTGNNIISYIFFVGIYSAFHFTTLEEYYSGMLYLGPLNGISDGSFFIIVASFISGLFGNNFWATPFFEIENTWMAINGVPILTYGQFVALSIGILNILDSVVK